MKHIRTDELFKHLCKLFEHDRVNSNVYFSAKMADPPHRGYPYVEVDVRNGASSAELDIKCTQAYKNLRN